MLGALYAGLGPGFEIGHLPDFLGTSTTKSVKPFSLQTLPKMAPRTRLWGVLPDTRTPSRAQGYLAYKKQRPPRTLQKDYA